MMNDNTLYAIFWIALFSYAAISNIASSLQPHIIREEGVTKEEVDKHD